MNNTVPHLLVDARSLTGARNGVTRVLEQLLQAWPEAPGFRTTLISNRRISSNARLPAAVGTFVDGGIWSKLPGSIWMTLRAGSIARQVGASHFLGTEHVLPLLGCGHLKTGVIVHDLVFHKFPETMLPSNRLMSCFFAPRSMRMAERLFCVSATTCQDLELYFGMKLPHASVAYPGITQHSAVPTSTSFGKAEDDAPLRLLVVGSLEPRKNIAQFLKVFLELSKTKPDLKLDIVSGGGWGNVLDSQLRIAVESHPHISVHLGISDAALDQLYREVDFLVFPSIYEGFGLPLLEAVGKCAVIANDIPVFRELAGHIDGVRLVNLGQEPRAAAVDLGAVIQRSAPARFANVQAEELFQWRTTADHILKGMGLLHDGQK